MSEDDENEMANASARLVPADNGTIVQHLRGETTGSLRNEARRMGNSTASIALIGGSPVMSLNGQPVIWFENWIRARTRRKRMR